MADVMRNERFVDRALAAMIDVARVAPLEAIEYGELL
jgi:hypothetical protein